MLNIAKSNVLSIANALLLRPLPDVLVLRRIRLGGLSSGRVLELIHTQVISASDARSQRATDTIRNICVIKLGVWGFLSCLRLRKDAPLTSWYSLPVHPVVDCRNNLLRNATRGRLLVVLCLRSYCKKAADTIAHGHVVVTLRLNFLKMPLDNFVVMLTRIQLPLCHSDGWKSSCSKRRPTSTKY
ncbi:hypothetical protein CONLIGDRAFT_497297 [Coniochaeta ligniaria NRRL 30616]|uniref:Uncharacterized protein n=1 Tax=Coniochaeta ligniaria NRRL 30616 TaxID=1408157 RepID=A0A1J7IYY9_9PEZI|nr:hypothetical protein CONLIGDRAFT_497297 [Coniochaeta ligniaria NRRL 30616]